MLTRFEMRRAGALLARLAYYPQRSHPREELTEMLWPDEDAENTRSRFRQVLTSLRHSMDSLGASSADLLLADRVQVHLHTDLFSTDVGNLEATRLAAARAATGEEKIAHLESAIGLYGGSLLPGFYEDWIIAERRRLEESYIQCLTTLARVLVEEGEPERALDYRRRAVAADPLREDLHHDLIDHYRVSGQGAQAKRQFHDMERILWKELRTLPSPALQKIGDELIVRSVSSVPIARSEPTVSPLPVPEVHEQHMPPADTSLPVPLTRFIGRDAEIEQLVRMLLPGRAGIRLISLVGLGGSGKTRLALEVARCLEKEYPDSVYFVPLAAVHDSDRLWESIASVVCPVPAQEPEILMSVVGTLRSRPVLLVLDNCEQVVDTAAPVIRSLLQRLPDLRLLVTSRCLFNIEGEQEYRVAPLDIPELPVQSGLHRLLEPDVSPSRVLDSASAQLFVDRARMVQPGFLVSEKNAGAVAALCRRLEGIPLAIELAAPWVAVLSPAQIMDRIAGQMRLLETHRSDTVDRHKSLWTALDWSFQQLTPDAQSLFLQLSVFQNGWTMAAAESICLIADSYLDRVAELQRHSLIQTDDAAEQCPRLRLMETLREFAREKLTPEMSRSLARRHALYFVALSEQANAGLIGPDQVEWLQRFQADHDNLRVALTWCDSVEGDTETGLRFAASLGRFWNARGDFEEAHRWLTGFLAKADNGNIAPGARAVAIAARGNLGGLCEEFAPSIALLQESLAIFRSLEDRSNIAHTLCALASNIRDLGRYGEARPLFEESRTLFEELGNRHGVGGALSGLATISHAENDYPTAYSLLEKSTTHYRLCGNKRGVAMCIQERGAMATQERDFSTAYHCFQRALMLFRSLNDVMWTIYTLNEMAIVSNKLNQPNDCYQHCLEGLAATQACGASRWEVCFLLWLGNQERERENPSASLAFFRDALVLSEEANIPGGTQAALKGIALLASDQNDNELAWCLRGCAATLSHVSKTEEMDIPCRGDTSPIVASASPVTDAERSAWQRGMVMQPIEMITIGLLETFAGSLRTPNLTIIKR